MFMQRIRKYPIILFVFLIFAIMPVVIYDHYYEMAYTKWNFSQNCIIIFFFITLLLSVIGGIVSLGKRREGKRTKTFLTVDLFVLLYAVSIFATFLNSEDPMAAWMGTEGWYMGTVAQTLFLLTYWMVSREAFWSPLTAAICLGGSVFPSIVAVFQRLGTDFLHLYWDMPDEVQRDYISTIGNRTWFSGYLCTVFPIAIWLFICAEKHIIKILLGAYLLLSFACLVITFSDSAYGALAVVLYVAGLISLRKREYLREWLKVVTLLPIACVCMEVLRRISTGLVRESRGVARLLLDFRFSIPLLVACVAMLIALERNEEKGLKAVHKFLAMRMKVWCILPIVLLVLLVIFIVLNTKGILPFNAGNSLLVFNGMWGDGRGIIWPTTLKMYGELTPVQKLFGVGQDCFALHAYSSETYGGIFTMYWGDAIMANAHNEWLNMLVCGGLFGLISYLGIFVSSIWIVLRESKKSNINLAVGIALSIISYLIHNLFCYQQVTAVVPMFVLLGLASGIVKNAKKSTKNGISG